MGTICVNCGLNVAPHGKDISGDCCHCLQVVAEAARKEGFEAAIATLSWMAHSGFTWNGRVLNIPSTEHAWKEYLKMNEAKGGGKG